MRKSFKAVLSLVFCFLLVSSTMLVSMAVGNISNLKATNVSATSATITWSAASGADGYELKYTTGSTSKTVTVKGKSTTSYKLSLTPGKSYTVQVRSYDKRLTRTDYGSWYKVTVKAVPAAVTNFKATQLAGGTSLKFTWTKVSGATGYTVYRYSPAKKKYVSCGSTTGSSLTVKGLYADTQYKFRIAAYYKYSGKNYYGSYTNITATPKYLAPTSLKVTKTTASSVTLSWGASSGAAKYEIYNSVTKKSVYVSKTSATLSGLKAGTVYKFRVRGYTGKGSSAKYGNWTSYITATTVTGKVQNLTASNLTQNSVDISFDKVDNALGYQVFLYDYATKKETKLIKQLTTNTYTVEGLEAGSTYRIGVCTYIKNNTYYYSSKSYVYIDTPPVVTTGEGTNATDIELKWTPVRKATSYTVERFSAYNDDWALIAEIPVETPYTGTVQSADRVAYLDAGVGENRGHVYRIKAYNGEKLINEVSYEATTTGITINKSDYSVTVNWNAPDDVVKYSVQKMSLAPLMATGSHYLEPKFEIEDATTDSYTFNLSPNDFHTYRIYATKSSGGGYVAYFTVKSAPLVIDSSNASKTAQVLMLVDAINRAKLYQGDVDVKITSDAKMVLDAIYFSEKMIAEMVKDMDPATAALVKTFFAGIGDNGEIAGDNIVDLFNILVTIGLATKDDIPELVTEESATTKYSFSGGYGYNENGSKIQLKSFIEPSGTADKLAYLYNEHDVTSWKSGFSSVSTTYYPSTGKYKVVATLKQEKFGTSTSRDDARYHHGFLSIYDALGFSGEGVDNELTTLGATKITAYIDAEGRIYSYTITSPFSTKFAATDSGASIGMKMSGTTTLKYNFTFK